MRSENRQLFLFTSGFPYGTRHEPFLETEINYLSEEFNEVIVFPRTKDTGQRSVPTNVRIDDIYVHLEANNKLVLLLRNLTFVFRVLKLSRPKWKDVLHFFKHYRVYLDLLARGIYEGEAFVKHFNDDSIDKNTVLYYYWFMNSIISIDYLKFKKALKNKLVCRGHRFDIYDGNWPTGHVPFFQYRMQVVDQLVLISKDGYDYIHQRIREKDRHKLQLSYLGVQPQTVLAKPDDHAVIRIVSCARVVGFKNVHQIPLVLKELDKTIEWVHFGDGPLMEELKENCKQLSANITVKLYGHQSNEFVLNYYKHHFVDFFISLSDSEGLPVSMMEAQSFGIPIIAKHVGGIAEIVNEDTGYLLSVEIEQIDLNRLFSEKKFHREQIINFFDNSFNAEINYRKFSKSISKSS